MLLAKLDKIIASIKPEQSASIVKSLVNLPVVNRIKAIKELFLEKLDNISLKLTDIDSKTNNLLANDSVGLQAAINLVEAFEKNQNETKEQYQLLQQLQTETKQQYQNLLSEVETLKQQNRVKIISDRYDFLNPEVGLMTHLYSYLPSRTAIDIGANVGDVSDCLLEAGYEVYAFEPFTPVFQHLQNRLNNHNNFHCYPLAIGSKDEIMDLNIATDKSDSKIYKDASLFNSLTKHSLPEDLIFTDTISVQVRTLESLHDSSKIPSTIGLVKIDTEGFELEVIRGMGKYQYPVVVAEFWDKKIPFAQSGAKNQLEEIVKEMKQKSYHWHIVIYRIWGEDRISFYSNYQNSVDNSWGNVFFFQDHQTFEQALMWCSAVLPVTYFA
jgi:FkbM family methyltransferase